MDIEGEILEMRLGTPGQGKTLSQNENVVLPALLSGVEVYINYWINWNQPNIHYFNDFEQVQDVRNCVVIFDEIGRILEPRNWDNENSGVRDFFQMHRHRSVDIYGTTQHVSLIAKTALIEIDRFLMCSKSMNGWLLKSIWKNFPYLVITEEEMSLKEIKILDSDFLINQNGNEEFEIGNRETFWYNKKTLLHRELDEFKTELVYTYCELCKKRQGKIIEKEKTKSIAIFEEKKNLWLQDESINLGYCEKHKNQRLILKNSPMYDTHHEFETVEKSVYFKPYHKVLKETPYRGMLSAKQLEEKKKLESNF